MIILAKKFMCPIAFCTGPNPSINIDLSLKKVFWDIYTSTCFNAIMISQNTLEILVCKCLIPKGTPLTPVKNKFVNLEVPLYHKFSCIHSKAFSYTKSIIAPPGKLRHIKVSIVQKRKKTVNESFFSFNLLDLYLY